MIKVLIIDDEMDVLAKLHHLIMELVPEISEIRLTNSGLDALQILQSYTPDIVLLDIEMPFQNGFEFLFALRDFTFDVIFMTSDNQYAIQALRFNALDYLLKPIEATELIQAVERHISNRNANNRKRPLVEQIITPYENKEIREFRLPVPSTNGIYFFSLRKIVRLQADRNYTEIYLVNKKLFVASRTLKYFQDILEPYKFIRTHKKHLVNALHIIQLNNSNAYIMMSDGTRIGVSRRKRERVLELLSIRKCSGS
jgi:two-component system, LytTR family, response regulator